MKVESNRYFFRKNQFIDNYGSCLRKLLLAFNCRGGSYTSILQSGYCFWQKSQCTILHGHWVALCPSRSFRTMVTLQSGHGITPKGHSSKCRCKGQKKDKKSINLVLLHLTQFRSHKHKKRFFKPPWILVSQPIRSLHYHTLRQEIRSFSPSLYLETCPMVIQKLKKIHTKVCLWRPAFDLAISFLYQQFSVWRPRHKGLT